MAQLHNVHFRGWLMVAIAFLGNNYGMGIVYGSFGPLLASTQAQFGIARGTASLGIAVMTLCFTGFSPLAGILVQRKSVRGVMLTGAVISAGGYLLLGLIQSSYAMVLLVYAILGIGICLLAVVAPLTLMSRWFARDRAKAMGVVTLPIFLFLTPFLIADFLPHYGRAVIYFALAGIFLLLIPALLLIVEYPSDVGQRAWGDASTEHAGTTANQSADDDHLTTTQILRYPVFWLITAAIGCLAGAGIIFTVHLIPFGSERHMSPMMASMMLSAYAASGILGNLAFGWLGDRITAPLTLIVICLSQAVLCVILLQVTGMGLLTIAGLLGAGAVPVVMLHGAAFSFYFGPNNVSRALGLSYAMKLPFNLGSAPLAGYLFDRTGAYDVPVLVVAVVLILAGGAIWLATISPPKDGRTLRKARTFGAG